MNCSHSQLALSHTIAHAEDRPPPWRFFIVFRGGFFCSFSNSFYKIEIAAFASIVTKPIFFSDVCASFQFLNGTLYGRQRKMQIFGYGFHGGIAAFCFFARTFTKIQINRYGFAGKCCILIDLHFVNHHIFPLLSCFGICFATAYLVPALGV